MPLLALSGMNIHEFEVLLPRVARGGETAIRDCGTDRAHGSPLSVYCRGHPGPDACSTGARGMLSLWNVVQVHQGSRCARSGEPEASRDPSASSARLADHVHETVCDRVTGINHPEF